MMMKTKHLKTHYHPEAKDLETKSVFKRLSTRAITLQDDNILLLYTERYQDYSLPGGGLDEGEDQIQGMIRELQEETGAANITNIQAFGIYEEYRPWYKTEYDIIHMISYCFTCDIDKQLTETNYESYEKANGMKPEWINIHKALAHNKANIANNPKKGLSIERETFLLEKIISDLL